MKTYIKEIQPDGLSLSVRDIIVDDYETAFKVIKAIEDVI